MKQAEKATSVADFLDLVGRADFQLRTGLSVQVVTRAKREGVFPDRWFWVIREFCAESQIKVPEHLFKNHPDAMPNRAPETASEAAA